LLYDVKQQFTTPSVFTKCTYTAVVPKTLLRV